ncbi:SDR family NAD(P)-dependent oxidoreductase [Liquorilactobacillus oeni]|uniref:Uncharacterized protein n=1 Tax=Liquorilactobacillus oeni DSM 19972 TaxID=1423777 RepID=A0A0R1MAX5_9LACO|nr:SDR family NAD(P)-dependent oxidoreductase [Liquorilactobacillus oeni]KRL05174.1 hypothetical protein FD46_GL001125 [Liquorilactobacillus oeni DSM 19972]
MSRKVWFVTGAFRGLGKALVTELFTQGYRVVITARKRAALREFSKNENALLLELDVTKQQQIRQAVEAAMHYFGQIDYLVNNNNAGYGIFGVLVT